MSVLGPEEHDIREDMFYPVWLMFHHEHAHLDEEAESCQLTTENLLYCNHFAKRLCCPLSE